MSTSDPYDLGAPQHGVPDGGRGHNPNRAPDFFTPAAGGYPPPGPPQQQYPPEWHPGEPQRLEGQEPQSLRQGAQSLQGQEPQQFPGQPPAFQPDQQQGPDQRQAGSAWPPAAGPGGSLENTESFLTPRHRARPANARGWRAAVAAVTNGRINPGPSAKQIHEANRTGRIQASLLAVHKIAVLSVKGGVGKTTVTVSLGNAIARERGDRVIAVDCNPDMGTLATRFSEKAGDANIEQLALRQSAEAYSQVKKHTVQNVDRLEMLGAQSDPRSTYVLSPQDYTTTMQILERYYNVILVDCGTSVSTSLFTAIGRHVNAMVIVASQDVPGVNGGLKTLRWLQAHGYGHLLSTTVVVLNNIHPGPVLIDLDRAETAIKGEFPAVKIMRIGYDKHLAEGEAIEFGSMKKGSREEFMELAGAVADHYPARGAASLYRSE